MKNTDANKYWREFEKFVLDYLKDKYNIDNVDFFELTPPSGDGGYDGVIYIPNNSDTELKEILFEAKLRTKLSNSLPMNDFSKVLIIAINRFAQGVFIATNIHFSTETINQLQKYSNRTGLEINTLNGKELYKWYETQMQNSKSQFDINFINFLKKASEISYDKYQEKPIEISYRFEYIQDLNRRETIISLVDNILKVEKGVALICGKHGSGKSTLSNRVIESLEKNNYYSSSIDLRKLDTSRAVFLKMIEIIWGVSPEVLLKCTETEFNEIFSYIGNQAMSEEKKLCLRKMFTTTVEEFLGHWDVYQYILIETITILLKHYTGVKKYCIHIENLDGGYLESIQFLLKIIRGTQNFKITYLIEIEEDIFDNIKMSFNEWTNLKRELFALDSIIVEYKVPLLSNYEKQKMIFNKLNALAEAQIILIADLLPDNPLILDSALIVLQTYLNGNSTLEPEFVKALKYFKKSYYSSIIQNTINSKVRFEGYEKMIIPMVILTLLKGACSIDKISPFSGLEQKDLIYNFESMGFFNIQKKIVSIKNVLYLNALQKFELITPSALSELATEMLSKIDIFYTDMLEKELLKLELLSLCNEKKIVIKLSASLGKILMQQGDFNQALVVFCKGYKEFYCSNMDDHFIIVAKFQIMQNMCELLTSTVRDRRTDLEMISAELKSLLSAHRKVFKKHPVYIEAKASVMYFEILRQHKLGKHRECLKIAYVAKRYARKNNLYYSSSELFAKILMLKSLSIKHLSGLQSCIQSFEYDIHKFPNLPILSYSYNTHKTYQIAREYPKSALKYFELNQKYYSKLPLSDQLHNRVNIANMHFFMKNYDTAKKNAMELISDAITFDINIELGRVYNLLGNIYVISDNFEKGKEFYQKSECIFSNLNHNIHLWPPLINLANIYIIQDEYMKAYSNLKKGIQILIYRKLELADSMGKDILHASKLYVGMIIALHQIYKLSKYLTEAKELYDDFLKEIINYLPENWSKSFLTEESFNRFFSETPYEHKGKIILKL